MYILSIVTLIQNAAITCHHPNLYFESAAVIVSLVLVGKYLEKKASYGATEAIHKLVELQPIVATVKKQEEFTKVCTKNYSQIYSSLGSSRTSSSFRYCFSTCWRKSTFGQYHH